MSTLVRWPVSPVHRLSLAPLMNAGSQLETSALNHQLEKERTFHCITFGGH